MSGSRGWRREGWHGTVFFAIQSGTGAGQFVSCLMWEVRGGWRQRQRGAGQAGQANRKVL